MIEIAFWVLVYLVIGVGLARKMGSEVPRVQPSAEVTMIFLWLPIVVIVAVEISYEKLNRKWR